MLASGEPSYTVPDLATCLPVSSEHLIRLVHAEAFPAVETALSGGRLEVAIGPAEYVPSARTAKEA